MVSAIISSFYRIELMFIFTLSAEILNNNQVFMVKSGTKSGTKWQIVLDL